MSKSNSNNPEFSTIHKLRLESETTRDRSQSTNDFERLSIMDTAAPSPENIPSQTDCMSPPPLFVKETRSKSLTPQPVRNAFPPYATLSRPKLRKGQTVDTSSIRKEEHEDFSLLNQYRIFEIIGHGSFGIVHKATSSDDTETYALKIVGKKKLMKKGFHQFKRVKGGRPAGPAAQDPLADIKKEIAILKKIDHPNVVKLVEVLDDPNEDEIVLVFEYISNGAIMKKIVPENRIPEDKARKYFIELMLGLEYLHSQKIIHRDIKPENLLLDEYDTLKIADFGVSEQWTSDSTDAQLKKSAGTRAFAAPETMNSSTDGFSGKPLDIWAAGVTLYCFIYGKVPFAAPNLLDLFAEIQSTEVSFPEDVAISSELKDFITRLLEKNPDKRITIDEMRSHPWITVFNGMIPSKSENCMDSIDVNENDIKCALQHHRTPIHILVMMKKMAKQRSLKNPYSVDSNGNSPVSSPFIPRRSSDDKRNSFALSKTIPSISVSVSEDS